MIPIATEAEDKARAFELLAADAQVPVVARELGRSQYTVRQWRDEALVCDRCGETLRKPTGRCGFCIGELGEEASR